MGPHFQYFSAHISKTFLKQRYCFILFQAVIIQGSILSFNMASKDPGGIPVINLVSGDGGGQAGEEDPGNVASRPSYSS